MKKLLSLSLIAAIFVISFQSCKKPANDQVESIGQVEFSFSFTHLKSVLKSLTDTGYIQGIISIVITIEDLKGTVVKNSEKIDLYNMNGHFISKPVSLATGGYKLTRFLALDARNNVVYASPVEGSAKAHLVVDPLPVSFTIQKDKVLKLTPEVLSAAESLPEDFGYGTFGFDIAKTFDFLLGVFVYDDSSRNFEMTTATLTGYSGSDSVTSQQLEVKPNGGQLSQDYDSIGITNNITLPERFSNYILKITKPDYKTYCDTFTKEDLRLYYRSEDKGPLVVVLEKSDEPPINSDIVDADGNIYHSVTIGSQIWMVENLKTTKYNDGTTIPLLSDPAAWISCTTPTYCWYDNDPRYKDPYGALYNWYTVNTGKLCPSGWHVPSDVEWSVLVNYLGGDSIAGGKLKETGTAHWDYPNTRATNESGFTALPGGGVSSYFAGLGYWGGWWSTNVKDATFIYGRHIWYGQGGINQMDFTRETGVSVRCIKD